MEGFGRYYTACYREEMVFAWPNHYPDNKMVICFIISVSMPCMWADARRRYKTMKTTTMAALAALMLAVASAPGAFADSPSGEKKEAFGPGGLTVKGLVGAGAGVCSVTEGVPFPCATGGAGAVFFDVSGWSGNTHREATVWAQWTGGNNVADEGFEMTVCADRDDTGLCTNADDTDDFVDARSNSAQYLQDGDPCSKDSKDCGDSSDAQAFVCVQEDVGGGFDDVVVFLSSWASAGLDGDLDLDDPSYTGYNVGDGTSTGTFDVYLSAGSYRSGYAGSGSGNDCADNFLHQN